MLRNITPKEYRLFDFFSITRITVIIIVTEDIALSVGPIKSQITFSQMFPLFDKP